MLSFQTIVCAIDDSDGCRRALILAADLAERARAALHLLHVSPLPRASLAGGPDTQRMAAYRERVERFAEHALGVPDALAVLDPVLHETYGEAPSDGIVRYATAVGADLVVMGTHRRQGFGDRLLGCVAAETLRHASVPVLVVPERAEPSAPGPDRPVVVAVDFSAHSPAAVRQGRAFAEAFTAPVVLAHVRDAAPDALAGARTLGHHPASGTLSRDEAHAALTRLADEAGGPFAHTQHVVPGLPKGELTALAERLGAGLLVLGTHGRTGWDRARLGSVAEWTARHAACPVLALPTAAIPTAAAVGADVRDSA